MNQITFACYGNSGFALYRAADPLASGRSFLFLRASNSNAPDTLQLADAWTAGLVVFVDRELPVPDPKTSDPLADDAHAAIKSAFAFGAATGPISLSNGFGFLRWPMGTAVLRVEAGDGATLTFETGKPAVGSLKTGTLSGEATTAWVALEPANKTDSVSYDLQPATSMLYQLGEAGGPWDFCETPLTCP